MANWKKVIVSGSDAHLKDVTASAGLNLPGIAAIQAGGQPNVTTPLVIDQYGNVSTGSKYALASGGDTVGASGTLTDNFVIVGTGAQGIEIANATSDANFNGAQVYGIASITSSGDLLFSQSAAEIVTNGAATIESANNNLVINANDINAATLDLTGNLTTNLTSTRVPFIGASGLLTEEAGFNYISTTDTLNVSKINSVSSSIVAASSDITSLTKVNAPAITGSTAISVGIGAASQIVARGAANGLHIGNVNSKTIISASSLILSSSGGITASVVPTTIRPPFYLGRKASGEIVQVPLANVAGGGSSTSGISGIDSGDNINISGINQVTTTTEILLATKISAVNGVASITSSDATKDTQNSSILAALTGTDNIRIKYEDGTSQDIGVAAFSDSISGNGGLFGVSFDAVIAGSPNAGGAELYKLVSSTVGIPTINVNENLVIAGSSSFGGAVTMSGDLIFSGSAGLSHQITGYPLGGTGLNSIQELQITSSHILNHGNISTDTIDFNSIQFIANQAIIISGSTQFGSGSGNTHQFTGSLLLSGSLVIDGSVGNTITLGSSTVDATEFGILDGATVSTNELNILDGATLSTSELNLLDGVTATTTELNLLDGVTATTEELNIIDGVTATTTELNILDGATLDVGELNILDGATLSTTELNILDGATLDVGELNILDGATLSTTELNLLDGVTATTDELNIIDGVTATTTELNILDGATLDVGELNILDGATLSTTELNLLDGVTATTTELNFLDGVTSAIQTQLDALAPIANPTFTGEIGIGSVNVNATEFGILEGATVTTDELNILDGVTVNAAHINSTLTTAGGAFTGNVAINGTNTLTVGGNATFGGNVNLGSGNDTITINGDLIVEGTTQTINSTNLAIEDRFILIGSGSSTTDTGFGGNFDVGIIFENRQGPNNDGFGQGTALYHDASDDRLNVARNVPSNIGNNQIGHGSSVEVGHVVTVRSTASLGTKLNTTENNAATDQAGDVIFGEGEMVIDGNKDLWIYVAS